MILLINILHQDLLIYQNLNEICKIKNNSLQKLNINFHLIAL